METSAEEQKRGEETNCLYSPCHVFEQLVKACMKCLGYQDDEQSRAHHTTSPSGTEREMKTTDEEFAVQSRATRVTRRPPKPPISSGRGGQTN